MVTWRPKHVAIITISIRISTDCIILLLCWRKSHLINYFGSITGCMLRKKMLLIRFINVSYADISLHILGFDPVQPHLRFVVDEGTTKQTHSRVPSAFFFKSLFHHCSALIQHTAQTFGLFMDALWLSTATATVFLMSTVRGGCVSCEVRTELLKMT
jgi:hypothetical protein